jgi:hypothetical protein
MLRTITVAVAVACGAMLSGCAADVAPLDTLDHGPAVAAQQADTTVRIFEVWLRGDTVAETILARIVEAGHAQLVEGCESNPGALVRVYNPLASGAYADVPCAAILGGAKTSGEPQHMLTSEPGDGATGESQQHLTPAGLLCGLLTIGVGLASTWSCERYPDQWCPWPAAAGTSTMSLICMFL